MEITALKATGSENSKIIPMPHLVAGPAENQADQFRERTEVNSQNPEQLESEEVEEVLEAFKEFSEAIRTKLNFSVHEENNSIVVRVMDKETNELIRQIPSDEMLSLQDKMRDLAGFLFSENV